MKHTYTLITVISAASLLTGCNAQKKTLAQNDPLEFTAQEKKLEPEPSLGKRRVATGFFVTDNGYFVTNYHVVKGATQIHITTAKGERVLAKVVSENPDIDIALAKADVQAKAVKWGTRQDVDKGQGVLTLGYPLLAIQGKEQKATFGRINSYSGIRGDPGVYQIDVPVQPGNSGGPLISENGVVIGVIKATFNQMAAIETMGTFTQNINYAVKSDQVLPMLEQTLGNQIKVTAIEKKHQEMPHLITKFERSVVMVEAE
jgi:S1-C subfamily serine protease